MRGWNAVIRRTAFGVVFVTGAVMAAAGVSLDRGKSTLSVEFSQFNVPVDAPFTKFTGTISYDDAAPGNSTAHIEIDMTSFDIGDESYNAEVRKKEWFDSAQFPKASFDALSLKSLGDGKLEATGKLSLKGKSQVLKVPVTLKTEGKTRVFAGAVPISRAYFGIGDPLWKDTVADQVQVKFRIVVPQAS
ncbi:YceI family protein [Hydrocarboniphaga sp.]|uniref:YceI family protein n=1 Tax=Hydrocarboniphaga sp. TaxID=2033016 RepID=UPI003D0CDA2F